MKSFDSSGKTIDEQTAALIPAAMKCHSWYVQQLSSYTWNYTDSKATKREVMQALNEVIQTNSPLYQNELGSISATQLNLLKAVSQGETRLTSTAVMRDYQLGTPNNVTKNRKSLIERDMILEHEGQLEFADPVLELWFNKIFFSKDYHLS